MSTEAQINRQNIRGLDFPCSPVFTREKIEAALDYKPKDDDIIISTYPKTGTTWIQYIVYEILNNGKVPPSQSEMRSIMPYMEASGTEILEKLKPHRVLKYHLPFNLTPYNPKTKYITIIRNPYGVLVSYYHFLRQITKVNLQFDDLFDAFVKGKCVYGDYFDNILSWYEHKDDNNILLLSYEKLKKDPRKGLLLISSFLGYDLQGKEERIQQILKHTSFEYMKANVKTIEKDDGHQENKKTDENERVNFFRGGSTGDKKQHFTEAQEIILKNRIEEKLRGSDVQRLWS
ncbi:hypothetical protein TNCT_736801 [Trichonephila clavata]|uniref:Sulfotransferase domain-containing protein n=1 Tax=Trichonephila clavata TaxID=2740835 RepID=A0A8X6F0H8_TRICU|nr:hypothetical protein TNCT_736801 [Trichonephila clavata]